MFSDHRVHMLDVHDWIELLQLLLYPAVKDTINSIMSNQYVYMMVYYDSRVVVNPRGNKLFENEAISLIIDVNSSVINDH